MLCRKAGGWGSLGVWGCVSHRLVGVVAGSAWFRASASDTITVVQYDAAAWEHVNPSTANKRTANTFPQTLTWPLISPCTPVTCMFLCTHILCSYASVHMCATTRHGTTNLVHRHPHNSPRNAPASTASRLSDHVCQNATMMLVQGLPATQAPCPSFGCGTLPP